MFTINAISKPKLEIDSLEYQECEIAIDNYKERFLACLDYWDIEKYENHWAENLDKFIHSNLGETFLISDIYDPLYANFVKLWILYREGNLVYFQNLVMFSSDIKGVLNLENIRDNLPSRQTRDEDGQEISEWKLKLSDLTKEVRVKNTVV